jgi:hypothetical protein
MHNNFDHILSISDFKSISYFHDFPPKPAERTGFVPPSGGSSIRTAARSTTWISYCDGVHRGCELGLLREVPPGF